MREIHKSLRTHVMYVCLVIKFIPNLISKQHLTHSASKPLPHPSQAAEETKHALRNLCRHMECAPPPLYGEKEIQE